MPIKYKTVTLKVDVPEIWTEKDGQNFFARELKRWFERKAYQAKRNAEIKAIRKLVDEGKLSLDTPDEE